MPASRKDTAEFTQGALLALLTEWADFKEHGQNIEAHLRILAAAKGLSGALPDPAG